MGGRLKVIFVCVENAGRSQMAEALARLDGGDAVEAHSAGSQPSGAVNPAAVEAMRELGYDLTTHASKSVDLYRDTEFDVAVTMGCGDACPNLRAKRRLDWQIPDPRGLPVEQVREVRGLIRRHVAELLASPPPPG